ncbi:MAG: hypothetical protein EBZ49_07925 [Proteobacteria bacterium]|nr:hypothetical protein [Pseudomonadota bacterium]
MPKKRYSPEEIIQHLRTVEIEEAKGTTHEEAARKVGVVDQAKRLKELEQENGRLKKIVADLSVDNSILKEVARGNF